MTGTAPQPSLQFEANTQWRRAWRFVGHRGRVTIENGQIMLYNHAGDVVGSGSVRDVRIDRPWWTLGNGCYITFSGQKYNLTLRSLGRSMATEALGGGIATTIAGRHATQRFMEALEQARAAA